MKDVLITGGAGKIGYDLVCRLLDSRYSITVLDLESKLSRKKLNRVKDKIKIIYGDVEDRNLIFDLVKKNDIVVDYAGIMPPIADLDEKISNSTNFLGTKNIVDAINDVNPDCIYVYMSFISIYGNTAKTTKRLTTNGETDNPDDFYSVSLIRSEEYIREHLKKYIILRMPIVLTSNNYYLKHIKLNRIVNFITVKNMNEIVIGAMKSKKALGNIYNISGFKANTTIFLKNRYKCSGSLGIHFRRLYYGEYDDSDEITDIINIKYQTTSEYLKELKKRTNPIFRIIKQIINFPAYLLFRYKTKK